jgi:hypothetical protein
MLLVWRRDEPDARRKQWLSGYAKTRSNIFTERRHHAEEAWRYWLSRRSHQSAISWEKFQKLKVVFVLPTPKIVHNV